MEPSTTSRYQEDAKSEKSLPWHPKMEPPGAHRSAKMEHPDPQMDPKDLPFSLDGVGGMA